MVLLVKDALIRLILAPLQTRLFAWKSLVIAFLIVLWTQPQLSASLADLKDGRLLYPDVDYYYCSI